MKTIVAGYTPDAGGQEALALAGLLARGRAARVLVTVVVPRAWGYPASGIDAEYARFLDEHAERALAEARELLPGAETLRSSAASATEGLLQAAQQHGADAIAIGSASGGVAGRLFLGGVSHELMHACPLPVAMAPRGYAVGPEVAVSRLTLAYAGAAGSQQSLVQAQRHAQAYGVPLRLASFVVRDRSMFPSAQVDREDDAIALWKEQAGRTLAEVQARLEAPVQTAVSAGPDWDAALRGLDWLEGELLLLGSSRLGLLARVFLGSQAQRILRAAPVPVLVLPRGA